LQLVHTYDMFYDTLCYIHQSLRLQQIFTCFFSSEPFPHKLFGKNRHMKYIIKMYLYNVVFISTVKFVLLFESNFIEEDMYSLLVVK
jgi:hypothetical protein